MNRLARISILWAIVALASFRSTAVANAISIDDNNDTDKLDTLLDQQDNRLSENHDDGASNPFGVIDGEEPSVEKVVDNNEDELLDAEAIRKKLRKNKITDILVACFFFVAAVWLVLATGYSIILLVLLRLQARGELDIYDENLGRVVLCNGKITLHFGCILRRYAIQLEEVSCSLERKILCFCMHSIARKIHSYLYFAFNRTIKGNYNDAQEIPTQKTRSHNVFES
jgi:hypothetical protein